ncbi:MAG: amidase family protein, partial [Desulfobulbia bacterium]
RIPGGSSSGSAIAVSDGMSVVALGTDTGGSCRIPAALCGIVGYKPTAARVSNKGVYPLSFSLDSVGPIANSVSCCITADALMSGNTSTVTGSKDIRKITLGVPEDYVLENLDPHVSSSFESALTRLSSAGVQIERFRFPLLNELTTINAKGGFAAAEAYAWHQDQLEQHEQLYDQRVSSRIKVGARQSAADYIQLCRERKKFIQSASKTLARFDLLATPTVPTVAPAIADLDDPENYRIINMLMLRNPSVVNFLDGCAISIPCHFNDQAPVGFMLIGEHGMDHDLFAISLGLEPVINPDFQEYSK